MTFMVYGTTLQPTEPPGWGFFGLILFLPLTCLFWDMLQTTMAGLALPSLAPL